MDIWLKSVNWASFCDLFRFSCQTARVWGYMDKVGLFHGRFPQGNYPIY